MGGLYNSKFWLADLDKTLAVIPELEILAGKSVMVTGCTGLICSAVVDVLIRWNETHEAKIRILAAGRNGKRIAERFEPHVAEEWFSFVPYDASSTDNQFAERCDYIIHGASNATPGKIMKEPVETMLDNVLGIKCLLDYARKSKSKRVLFVSSSEVYGKKENAEPYRLGEYGFIDLLNSRNSSSLLTRPSRIRNALLPMGWISR